MSTDNLTVIKRFVEAVVNRKFEDEKNNNVYTIVCIDNHEEKSMKNFLVLIEMRRGVFKGQKHVFSICVDNNMSGGSYPDYPPTIKFLTNIFHPNISLDNGGVCMDVISSNWSPMTSFISIILYIKSLLDDPNFHGTHLNAEACKLYSDCMELYENKKKSVGDISTDEDEKLFETCFKDYTDRALEVAGEMYLFFVDRFPSLLDSSYTYEKEYNELKETYNKYFTFYENNLNSADGKKSAANETETSSTVNNAAKLKKLMKLKNKK